MTQTVTDDNYDEVDTAQADMIAAQQTILQEYCVDDYKIF